MLENLSCDLIPRGTTLRGISSLCIYMYTLHEINTTVLSFVSLSISLPLSILQQGGRTTGVGSGKLTWRGGAAPEAASRGARLRSLVKKIILLYV